MPTEDDHEAALREALGRVIAMRRAELGLKRNDLRDRSQLSYPYVAELENGTKRPSQAALQAIAAALELRPSELLERADALLGGEDLLRSASPSESAWFHRTAPVALPGRPAKLVSQSTRRPKAEPLDDDLRSVIAEIVREVVRDELERAGVLPATRRVRGPRPDR